MPTPTADEYQCSMCGGVFPKGWTDEEAIAEKQRDFAQTPLEACNIVCDDCYQNVRPDRHPKQYAEYLAEQHSQGTTPNDQP